MFYVCSVTQSIEAETEQEARNQFEWNLDNKQWDADQMDSEPDDLE